MYKIILTEQHDCPTIDATECLHIQAAPVNFYLLAEILHNNDIPTSDTEALYSILDGNFVVLGDPEQCIHIEQDEY